MIDSCMGQEIDLQTMSPVQDGGAQNPEHFGFVFAQKEEVEMC